ncbi:D-2-hydroxyacid dehydrogenase [Ectothiorhodospiraceae bacterium WFHF3C12]|nr:D-2-hydroxyacid dehydrogenase [Ectothiorhodospiraceae bacterium WFHF3C12]
MSSTHGPDPVVAVLTAEGEPLPPGLEPLFEIAQVRHADDLTSLRGALTDARVLMVTDFRTGLLDEAWSSAEHLEWIHATSAGVDAVLIEPVRNSDIPVTNARGIFDRTIAEYVIGAITLFAKDFLRSFDLQRERRWQHRDTERVAGQRVLVVGAGSIGRQIARLCRAMGLNVDGMASRERPGDDDFGSIHASGGLLEVVGDYDFVVIAAPLTEGTRGLFDRRAFRAMQRSARLINIGRGPIVVTDDLVTALGDGSIAGAALDVFEEEPLPPDHPLWTAPNTMLTAHMAGDFIGWKAALSEQFIANFSRWRDGQALFNIVDKQRGYVPPDQE